MEPQNVLLVGLTQVVKKRPHWFAYPAVAVAGFLISTATFQAETKADISLLKAGMARLETAVDRIDFRQRSALIEATRAHTDADTRLRELEKARK